jgi:putative zinc finger/helix-turn-helix YgiT family protein
LGVTVYRCGSCGEELVSIPRLAELHRALASAVISKHAMLTAEEVRFLRTHLDKSSEEFAQLVGVSREQVSRWEHGATLSATADRLIRLLVAQTDEMHFDVTELTEISATAEPLGLVRLENKASAWRPAA